MYTFNYINQLYNLLTPNTYTKFIFIDKYISILTMNIY